MRHATRMDQSEKASVHSAQNLGARMDTLYALIQAQKEHFQSQIETQKEHVQSQIISTQSQIAALEAQIAATKLS